MLLPLLSPPKHCVHQHTESEFLTSLFYGLTHHLDLPYPPRECFYFIFFTHRCQMCWFTVCIFDTFNEFIQKFYARKDLTPSIIAAMPSSSADLLRVCRLTAGDPIACRTKVAGGHWLTSPSVSSLPPFLGHNEFDESSAIFFCC